MTPSEKAIKKLKINVPSDIAREYRKQTELALLDRIESFRTFHTGKIDVKNGDIVIPKESMKSLKSEIKEAGK